MNTNFKIESKIKGKLGRAGTLITPHGALETPAFVGVATQATIKALSPEQVREAGIDIVLSNTYHLYLKPGAKIISDAGGLHKYMHWNGPTMTDSGGFQVFSLGAAFNKKIGKILKTGENNDRKDDDEENSENVSLVKIDEDGVDFKSVVDGSSHRFTPEKSIEVQHMIGADIIFAFDECPSPTAPESYQGEALDRTIRWGERSLEYHKKNLLSTSNKKALESNSGQQLFGIIQGGRVEKLRRKSAQQSAKMDFDGYGIGGSFNKDDIGTAVEWVNEELPEEKPRHLLGIGDPNDLIEAIENGCDTFDCVAPTRLGRNSAVYTRDGRINIVNSEYRTDFSPIDSSCGCYTCKNYTKSYVAHLFRSNEMFAATLASIHNLFFISDLVKRARKSILENNFEKFKEENYLK
jgi:queuine tRNA-ribosyltransferase